MNDQSQVRSEPCEECGVDTAALLIERDTIQSQLTQAQSDNARLSESHIHMKANWTKAIQELTKAKEDWQIEHAVLKMIANRVCDATQNAQHTNEGICEGVERVCKERGSLQVQRDQVLHLLEGGTLTEQQVTESGLGVGVLSEQRHHEYMRCKAETERDEAVAACAVMRDLLQRIERWPGGLKRVCQLKTDFNAILSTSAGAAFLERMKEAEWLLSQPLLPKMFNQSELTEYNRRYHAFQKGVKL